VTVLLVATITFALARLAPGDPFTGETRSGVTEAIRAQRRAHHGLDRPIAEQYARWLWNVARGDFGYSLSLNVPVRDAIAEALPNTLVLLGVALAGMFGVGIFLGALQAARRGTWVDRAGSAVSLFFYSVPDFWLALMAVLVFAQWLRVLPVGGVVSADVYPYLTSGWARLADRLRHLVLPAGTLVLLGAGGVARFQRAALLDVAHEDWLRTARAKGLGERAVLLRHALRNALLPVITVFGLSLPALVGGATFIEYVFAWPGMGRLAVEAVGRRDYDLVTACAVLGGALVAAGSLLADLLHAVADPRLREGGA
jgi:peptide/nickel transport system permease protein